MLTERKSFYDYVCGLLFEKAKPYLTEAVVVLDGKGSRTFRRQFASYLKRKIDTEPSSTRYIRKVKLQDSAKNNLLQLADMVCGAVYRSLNVQKTDALLYRALIKHRELFVEVLPK